MESLLFLIIFPIRISLLLEKKTTINTREMGYLIMTTKKCQATLRMLLNIKFWYNLKKNLRINRFYSLIFYIQGQTPRVLLVLLSLFPLRYIKAFALKATTKLVDNWRITRIYRIHIRSVTLARYRQIDFLKIVSKCYYMIGYTVTYHCSGG